MTHFIVVLKNQGRRAEEDQHLIVGDRRESSGWTRVRPSPCKGSGRVTVRKEETESMAMDSLHQLLSWETESEN
jgi:hypothetical protein